MNNAWPSTTPNSNGRTTNAKPSSNGSQKAYEAEQAKCEKLRKARSATFERIIAEAPATFSPEQLRVFLRLLIHINPYDFLEEAASHFASDDETTPQSEDEIVLAALSTTADDKLIGLALRMVLSDHIGIPNENEPDWLTEAEQVFAPKKPKAVKAPATAVKKAKKTPANIATKPTSTRKKAA